MKTAAKRLIFVAWSAAIGCGLVTAGARAQKPDKGIETFDAVWRLVNETYFDPAFNGVDWQKAREEYRPSAERASTLEELRSVIREMLGRVGGSHLQLLAADVVDGPRAAVQSNDPGSPAVSRDGDLGIDVRALNGQLLVTRVEPGQSAANAGVKPGWILSMMDGTAFEGRAASDPRRSDSSMTARALRRFVGAVGSTATFACLDLDDRPVILELERTPRRGQRVKLDNLPEEYVVVTYGWLPSRGRSRIGVTGFNTWAAPVVEQFGSAVRALHQADGLIVDLRGNSGGVAHLIPQIASHFFADPVVLGKWIHRGGEIPIRTTASPIGTAAAEGGAFRGPVAILIDGLSHSSTELFAAAMQSLGRARVFGEVSYGGALGAMISRLPNGDVLEHAVVQFVTAAGETPGARGIRPDQLVALSRQSLIAGEDPVIRAAQQWIEGAGGSPRASALLPAVQR